MSEEKEVRDEFLRSAIAKVAIYAYRDGYFPDETGIEKRRELDEFLSSEEMMAVKPYIGAIQEIALGFPNYNEKSKIHRR